MLIVKIHAGLGNQLFQYAMGRHLSKLMKTELLLDTTFYYNPRYLARQYYTKPEWHDDYNLDKYNIKARLATQMEIDQLTHQNEFNKIVRKIHKLVDTNGLIWRSPSYASERPYSRVSFGRAISMPDLYINGYWGGEYLFTASKTCILNELTLKDSIAAQASSSVIESIASGDTVSLHIRRGEYLSNPYWRNLGIDYYMKASEYICNKVQNPKLVLFSDDIEWVKENFNFDQDHVFIANESPNYIDLYYMSLCKHNIIANSTYSWWGAYLNMNPNKIVVAPSLWYGDMKAQKYYEKNPGQPENWIRM